MDVILSETVRKVTKLTNNPDRDADVTSLLSTFLKKIVAYHEGTQQQSFMTLVQKCTPINFQT